MHGNLAPKRKTAPVPEKPEKPKLLLPVVALADLDLLDELYKQYVIGKQLLSDADADEAPLNQKAQTLNSVVSILGTITKMRTELYNAEKLKSLEGALLETLKEFPEMSDRFLELYTNKAESL